LSRVSSSEHAQSIATAAGDGKRCKSGGGKHTAKTTIIQHPQFHFTLGLEEWSGALLDGNPHLANCLPANKRIKHLGGKKRKNESDKAFFYNLHQRQNNDQKQLILNVKLE
jgi:hypothetical protein